MKTIKYPSSNTWSELAKRPTQSAQSLDKIVDEIFQSVQRNGDKSIIEFTEKFDKVKLTKFRVTDLEMSRVAKNIPKLLKSAIDVALKNITKFHKAQKLTPKKIETTKGVVCWREARAIERVGIYIPGGSAPLFSTVLMLGIPAKLAGCKEIILCSPPDKNGRINPVILYAASLVGVTSVFSVGGIQAIAAMTFGTESIPAVSKIFGPGNQYVTAAKQRAQNFGVAIDMPAGPSEVLIITDKNSHAEFVAADLLSQAEHGADSQVILLCTSEKILNATQKEIEKQLKLLSRKAIAKEALKNSRSILFKTDKECIQFSNLYAPEHLVLATKNAEVLCEKVVNAGSVFVGNYSCESAGDYASGTNHTLPTNGYAKNYSGVSLDSFIRQITFQKISKKGIQNIGPSIEMMAEAEQLFAHKNAVTVRLKRLKK